MEKEQAEQAELEVGSPAESSTWGRQDEYPTVYRFDAPEYFQCKRPTNAVKRDHRLRKTTIALAMALVLSLGGVIAACYFAILFHHRAQEL